MDSNHHGCFGFGAILTIKRPKPTSAKPMNDSPWMIYGANGYSGELIAREARRRAFEVVNAGAIFVGGYTPVSLGDYAAGSNHVLPTGGSSRHSAGLHVQTFLRGVQVVEYSDAALSEVAEVVTTLAAAEDLPAHASAITVRSASGQVS